jgi:uroporphyrinogen decarboxylase
MEEMLMTAREIITKRLNHEGTDVTPYEVIIEPELEARLAVYYNNPQWKENKLRQFTCCYLYVDTQLYSEIDERYMKDAYGAMWRMDKKPWHLETPPLKEPSLEGYDFPGPDVFTKQIYESKAEAIRLYEANDEQYRLIHMGWGIFEHSWRIRGFENVLTDMITDEDFYNELTLKLMDNYLEMVRACKDIPADAFVFGDDWGDQRGIIFGAERWRTLIKPRWAKIYAEVHKQGKKVIHHSCGSVAQIYDDLIEIGMDCHESVQPKAADMAPEIIKEKYGKGISFWGCLGSQGILNKGTPKEIEQEIKRLAELFKKDGGFVLAPAKPLVDEMDIDKAVAVIETLSGLN